MKKVVYIDCRRTRRGALTTASGEVVDRSGTGSHWTEKLVLESGDRVPVTDISNSGKHNCYWLSLDEKGNEVKDPNRDIECAVCVGE